MAASIDKHPLQKRRVIKKAILRSIKWYILLGVLIITNLLIAKPKYLAIAAVFIFFLELVYQSMHYKRYFYNLDDRFIMVREGIIARREKTIPYKRIHDVYVDQDILDRVFKLWDIHFTTADSKVFNLHIDGLNSKSAKAIREYILNKI